MSSQVTDNRKAVTADLYNELFQMPVAVSKDRELGFPLNQLLIVPTSTSLNQTHSAALLARYQQTQLQIRQSSLDMRLLGYGVLFDGVRIYKSGDFDWVLMSLGEDPLYAFYDQHLPVPTHVKNDLIQIQSSKITLDQIYIAHQVPANVIKPGEAVPLHLIMPAPPQPMQQRLNFLSSSVLKLWGAVSEVTRTTASIGLGLAGGLGGAIAFDPVLIGVQLDKKWRLGEQPIGMWYYLTHWFWPLIGKEEK